MFSSARRPQSNFASAISNLEVVYHSVVRSIRRSHNNAFMAIYVSVFQNVLMILAFYIIFVTVLSRVSVIRGDLMLYIMSGIFLFLTHTKALGAVVSSEGPASPMMQHAPMNTAVSIASAALGVLYVQVLTMLLILFIYHVAFKPITIDDPISAFAMFLLAWFTGAALGLVLLALKPWFPSFVGVFTTVYQRANMIASGKMFVANAMPGYMLALFDWNPLFHTIDQSRGYVFINYFPRNSTWEYAIWVGIVLVMLGLMGEFYTRKHASSSWYARR